MGYNQFAYCENNPVTRIDPTGSCARAWTQGYHGPCPGQGMPGCMDNWQKINKNQSIIESIDRDSPPNHPEYQPPKKGGGKKVRNSNGHGWGWPAKDGGIWVPDPDMHGGEGWTVQYPSGNHKHAYPSGKMRNHFEYEQSMLKSVGLVAIGVTGILIFSLDNFIGFGVADDPLIVSSGVIFAGGINGLRGRKVCTECGEVIYEY